MVTYLKNVNVVSADEVKTVCRKIDTNKKGIIRHGQRNQTFKRLILFITLSMHLIIYSR